MSELPIPRPERESMIKHRRQVRQQIILPFIIAILLIAALAVLVGIATFSWGGDVARWAQISTIWLVIPLMIFGLIILALFAGIVYGLAELLKVTPRYTGIAQNYVIAFKYRIQYYADQIIEPVLTFKSWLGVFIKEAEKQTAPASGEKQNAKEK
jgi:predicted PurR-regulated permease PerM